MNVSITRRKERTSLLGVAARYRLYDNWQWTARSSDRLTAKPMSWSIQAKQSQDETDSIPTNDGHTLRS
ncbi:hypothetical protein T03_305 [Trichinella britovi]|uniref:Uncharacterized protein n=1 Tax=Trichinella britovi TaxID=45882 RepID=A0A0V0Z170_TRIBR|nr:hypothetical protein T03_305 [Trichinella britovi]